MGQESGKLVGMICLGGMCLALTQCQGFIKLNYAAAAAKLLQSCLTLCDLIDGSPPHSLIPGILQARTLEWVAIAFSELNYGY